LILAASATSAGERHTALRILAFGDSLTAGYGLALAESFPAQLQAALRAQGIEAEVLNAGVSGDTTSGGLARLEWALAEQPKLVILELGANDALRGIDPALTRANLAAMLQLLKERGLPVLLAGMCAPLNLGTEHGKAFNAIYPDLAESFGVLLYPFFLDGVVGQPARLQEDGLHPNRAGVETMVAGVLPNLLQVLAQAGLVPANRPPPPLAHRLTSRGACTAQARGQVTTPAPHAASPRLAP
jgi:acyl-CoA thioesterase-1